MANDLGAELLAERHAHFRRLKGGFPIPLAGALYWLMLAWVGQAHNQRLWTTAAMWGSGLIFPLALGLAKLFHSDFLRDRTAVSGVLVPTFVAMLLFWPMFVGALWTAPALTSLILAIGLSLHWPVIGWSYGKTLIYTAHAVVRAGVVFYIWNWIPEGRLTLLPLSVTIIYLATVAAILLEVLRMGLTDRR